MRKLVAVLACRNQSSRLYGKPLQNLDICTGLTILDFMIASLKSYPEVSEIVLAVSHGPDNEVYKFVAKKHNIRFIYGSEEDVLKRLIDGCKLVQGTDIFRLTSESPFTYEDPIPKAWADHQALKNDLTALDNLPDGSGFEIISLPAYEYSWNNGNEKHRSEFSSLYIREHKTKFRIGHVNIPDNLKRTDIRLTVDYPEDLILCRYVYQKLYKHGNRPEFIDVINLIDETPHLASLVQPFISEGLKTMYI